MPNPLRRIPSVNELLESPPLRHLVDRASHGVVVSGIREFLSDLRSEIQSTAADGKLPSPSELAERIARWIVHGEQPTLRPAVNATGILLHTGLGRAPLAEPAISAMVDVTRNYASVELDLATGTRSSRCVAVEPLLQKLTGCEAATVVNNNAGATLLTLAALTGGRDVLVSRGQLVEIGGSYRLPEVMKTSGSQLKEVGTTNKTRISDYEEAITFETAALMRVHASNFVIQGFSEQASLHDLVALAKQRDLLMIDDIGSGALWDCERYGISGEPRPQDSVRAGADIVLFSGDKLLGGPQCGIILGKQHLVHQISKHPLARALRVDKITLAGLAATLQLYKDPEQLEQTLPLLTLLGTPLDNLKNRAERLAPQLADAAVIATADPIEETAYLGGGSMPNQHIPTWCVALKPETENVDSLATRLRNGLPPVCGRVQNDALLLDLRTVFPRQDGQIVQALRALSAEKAEKAESTETDSDSPDPR
ncbi:MAG: L-seryl-tRNA(Sec) selenium transferase [Planctomycetota bacterium]